MNAKKSTQTAQSSQNVSPRVAPDLQNEAPEPPKFSPNLDLATFECQVAPQEASEAPPKADLDPKSSTNQRKINTTCVVVSSKARQTHLQKYNGVHLALAWRTFCKATVSKIPFVFLFYNDWYPKLPLHLPSQGTKRCKKTYFLRFCFQRFCVQRFSLSEMLTFEVPVPVINNFNLHEFQLRALGVPQWAGRSPLG